MDDYPDLVVKHAEIQFLPKHKCSDELYLDENPERNINNEEFSGRKTMPINEPLSAKYKNDLAEKNHF